MPIAGCDHASVVVQEGRMWCREVAGLPSRVLRSIARSRRLLLGLEVVEQDAALLGLLTPVLDDNARAVDDLAGVALAVDLACKRK